MPNYREHSFDIKQLAQQYRISSRDVLLSSHYDDQHMSQVIHMVRKFASSAPRETDVTQEVQHTIGFVPVKTTLNYFRMLVTSFCPDLDFGWLHPKQEVRRIPYHVTNKCTSYNLYPVTTDEFRQQYGAQYRIAEYRQPTPLEWLSDTPLTPAERYANIDESYENDLRDSYRRKLDSGYY